MILHTLDLIARGGGGGSGGGGGGGGGSGEGGIFAFFAFLGYGPVSFIMAKARKHNAVGMGLLLAIPALIFISSLCAWVFGGWSVLTFCGGIAGFFADKFGINARIAKKAKQASGLLSAAAKKDANWNQAKLQTVVQNTFTMYQAD
jgi:hypothetical protein